MNSSTLKRWVPTLIHYLERRQHTAKNQLPKHLRPLPLWPLWLQIVINIAVMTTVILLIVNRDDFLTEAAPGMGLVICLLTLIYTLISAFKLRHRYQKVKGRHLALVNLGLMIAAFVSWVVSIVMFMP